MTKFFAVFNNKRMLIILLLGFSSGLPLALTGSTLQAWLSEEKVDIATIGLFALVGLPYAMKFLWAPIMDNKPLPFLGLRRGWMVVCQAGLFLTTAGLAMVNPGQNMNIFSLIAFALAFFSASQDIVIDAYRTEIITNKEELGAGAGVATTGYRIATVVSGGLALVLADHLSWMAVYVLMAAINLVGMITVFFAPEPEHVKKTKVLTLKESIVMPLNEFFLRNGAMEILIFIMVYKLSTLMATALTTKFLLDLGYTKTMIGTANKVAGLIASILGTLAGGSLMVKLGLKRSLWIFGIIQSLVGLTFLLLSWLAGTQESLKDFWLIVVISMDNFMMGLGTAALIGFMMNICNKQFTATQYALLTSVMAVSRVILIAHAGTLVEKMGWNWFFISTVPLAIPGLLLLNRYDQWQTMGTQNIKTKMSTFDLSMIWLFLLSLVCLSSDPLWKLFNKKEFGLKVVLAGAIGIVLIVAVGLIRPHFSKGEMVEKSG